MSYLVEFGIFVGKDRVAISLGVVVIDKNKSIAITKEPPWLS
jgi:hypothetical protein